MELMRFLTTKFESSVNSEGIETFMTKKDRMELFESSVNSEGIETEEKED